MFEGFLKKRMCVDQIDLVLVNLVVKHKGLSRAGIYRPAKRL